MLHRKRKVSRESIIVIIGTLVILIGFVLFNFERINLFLEITGMSYIDFRVDYNDNPYFIEIGTMYGISDNSILPLSAKAEGKEFTDLVNYDIGIALKRKQNNEVV